MRIFLFFILMSVVGVAVAQPCNYTLDFFSQLSSGQSDTESANLAGSLTSVTFNLNFSGVGASYPSDMMVYIYAPNGDCVVWGGWNIAPTGGCQNIGTGANNSWPFNWNTTANGFYSYTLNTNAYGLDGSGEWSVTIQNAWTGSSTATYNLDVIFNGLCDGDCFDPEACNFEPTATIANNDLCEYAIDYYPSGLYDCDGNCYLDFDGDLICNELEVPGCQEPWACNYNPQATDPPLPGFPCTYPQSDDVDCDGNSMLPQFLTQPQDLTVSCESIPEPPAVATQAAPAAITYHNLFPNSCYDNSDVEVAYTTNTFPGDCPGNYTIQRNWLITDCMGFQNAWTQTIQVVDNLVPVVSSGLDTLFLGCIDNVVFPPIVANDECGGAVSLVNQPAFVTLPGTCPSEFTEKKITTLSDECGNVTEVEQVIVVQDNAPPIWLNAPDELIVTDNINGDVFDEPVAEDLCSDVVVNVTNSYGDGSCPLSVVLTRTFTAEDQCGNSSSTFVQTIQEATDLSASLVTDEVTCHGGSDGQAVVSIEGGVAPYTTNWGGYDPSALEAGNYNVTVFDDNLCQQSLSFLITEPSEFSLDLTSTVPDCSDPNSGTISADVVGYGGPVDLEWGDANPDMVSAGEYTVVATDTSGCFAVASVVVDPADIPDDLELNGSASVAQGDSAAYYYEYTLGSNYAWTYTGAEEQQVFNSCAISLMWTEPGFHEVCVTETNQDGCTGNPVCMEVFVEDDVWSVEGPSDINHLIVQPSLVSDVLVVRGLSQLPVGTLECWSVTGQKVFSKPLRGQDLVTLDVSGWAAGQYLLRVQGAQGALRFSVQH